MTNHSSCSCQSGTPYTQCCQPLHTGQVKALKAEQLMRSRYSAFVLGKIEYLIATLHPDKRQTDDHQTLKKTIEQTSWLGLRIIKHHPQADLSQVEFVAFYQEESIHQLHERSNFIKQDNQWFYVDGEFLPPVKLSRNDPCFCGSGKKFKRCHAVGTK
jgi:SEC-C motif-containing protein